jgi:hypothetical protein
MTSLAHYDLESGPQAVKSLKVSNYVVSATNCEISLERRRKYPSCDKLPGPSKIGQNELAKRGCSDEMSSTCSLGAVKVARAAH